jgi:hypothetical protein
MLTLDQEMNVVITAHRDDFIWPPGGAITLREAPLARRDSN